MVTDTAKDGARRVPFNPPLEAKYMSVDGSLGGNCLVLNTGESGALLEHVPPTLNQFFLIFTSTSAVRPVYRLCKRAWVQGSKMEVDYVCKLPSFARHM